MNMMYYISKGGEVIKNRPTPLVCLCLINLILSFKTYESIGAFLPGLILLVAYPVVYGRYVELLRGNPHISYGQIFNKHWLNFILVNLVISTPLLLISFAGLFLKEYYAPAQFVVRLILNVLKIYVIPLVFLMTARLACIPLGLKYLVENIKFSVPLVLLTLFPTFVEFSVRNMGLVPGDSVAAKMGSHLFSLFYIVLNFIAFITATLVLQDKLGMVEQKMG